MPLMEWKAEPINRDILLFVADLEPREQSRRFGELAAVHIDDAKSINLRALGRVPRSKTFVDGREGAALSSVREVITTEFELLTDVLSFIARTLEQFSPVKRGRYRKSHMLFADGTQIDIHNVGLGRLADEYVFVNVVPYARKIERGLSQQAPDGVYQATATLARGRFGNIARITFTYRGIFAGERGSRRHGAGLGLRDNRSPAVIVRPF